MTLDKKGHDLRRKLVREGLCPYRAFQEAEKIKLGNKKSEKQRT